MWIVFVFVFFLWHVLKNSENSFIFEIFSRSSGKLNQLAIFQKFKENTENFSDDFSCSVFWLLPLKCVFQVCSHRPLVREKKVILGGTWQVDSEREKSKNSSFASQIHDKFSFCHFWLAELLIKCFSMHIRRSMLKKQQYFEHFNRESALTSNPTKNDYFFFSFFRMLCFYMYIKLNFLQIMCKRKLSFLFYGRGRADKSAFSWMRMVISQSDFFFLFRGVKKWSVLWNQAVFIPDNNCNSIFRISNLASFLMVHFWPVYFPHRGGDWWEPLLDIVQLVWEKIVRKDKST